MKILAIICLFIFNISLISCAPLPNGDSNAVELAAAVSATTEVVYDSTMHDHGDMTHDHGDVTHDHGDGDHDDHGGHSMMMYFHVSSHATILFEGWHTMTYDELFLSALAIIVFSILYEGFKELRQYLLYKDLRKNSNQTAPMTSGSSGASSPPHYKSTDEMQMESSDKISHTDNSSSASSTTEVSRCKLMLQPGHIVQSLLHVLQLFFSYCLMLIFMTYNVYLCLALVIGGGIGYWVFAVKRHSVVDHNDHCN